LKFRIFLTYLLEKNERQAKARLDAIPLINERRSPFTQMLRGNLPTGTRKKGANGSPVLFEASSP